MFEKIFFKLLLLSASGILFGFFLCVNVIKLYVSADAGKELCFGFILFTNTLMQPLKSAETNT